MRRPRTALTIAFTCVALMLVMSGPAGALSGERGSGRGTTAFEKFSFRARGSGGGIDASGVSKTSNNLGTWVGEISCMTVADLGTVLAATLGGTITSGPSNVGAHFRILAYDYDNGNAQFDVEFGGTACEQDGLGGNPVTKGRISLIDA